MTVATKEQYYVRKVRTGRDGKGEEYGVYCRTSGLVDRFLEREAAIAKATALNTFRAEQERMATVREAKQAAEEVRRAALTPDERQREDDETSLRQMEYELRYKEQRFLESVETIASGFEYAAKRIREGANNYQEHNAAFGTYPVESTVRGLMDTLFAVPQWTKEKYAVQESYEVITTRERILNLREKLGLPRYPKLEEANDGDATAE